VLPLARPERLGENVARARAGRAAAARARRHPHARRAAQRLLAGLHPPPRPVRRRRPVLDPFWPERTLAENFTNNGHGGHLDERRLAEALEITEAREVLESLPLGLGTVFDNNGRSLSRGESQRLFLAVALYQRPAIVVLDEILSSVPLPMRRRILGRLRALSPEMLLVYVTPTAEELADFDAEVRFTRRAWSSR
jgi:ABC-type dipeptide/oligopeptide/nickel transport system ATPase component